jgi:transcription antitermination protein NusB
MALQSLYEFDLSGHPIEEVLERRIEEAVGADEASPYARQLVLGVIGNLERIDSIIGDAAPNWPISQMARIDKNILRLAIFEVLFNNTEVPPKAAINEAVELAKSFGSDSSSRFVNGVLGTVVARVSPEQINPQELDESRTGD